MVAYSCKDCAVGNGSVFIRSREITTPEGLAFAKGHLYVARYS